MCGKGNKNKWKQNIARTHESLDQVGVFPNDVNNHDTLFGGKLMSDVDQVASISAARHSRRECVTASTDSVDFLSPIRTTDYVFFESYVTWTGHSSMEIFVKIIAEDLKSW